MSTISNFTEIPLVGASLILADGQTDGRANLNKLIGAFRDNASKPTKNIDVRGLPGKYPAILNISRSDLVTLM